jgi:hypothetical protein
MPPTVSTGSLSRLGEEEEEEGEGEGKRRGMMMMMIMKQTLHVPVATLPYIQETALIGDTSSSITGYPA